MVKMHPPDGAVVRINVHAAISVNSGNKRKLISPNIYVSMIKSSNYCVCEVLRVTTFKLGVMFYIITLC